MARIRRILNDMYFRGRQKARVGLGSINKYVVDCGGCCEGEFWSGRGWYCCQALTVAYAAIGTDGLPDY